MSTDFRALCADLLWALENAIRVIYHEDGTKHISTANPIVNRARAALADEPAVPAPPSDGEVAELVSAVHAAYAAYGWVEEKQFIRFFDEVSRLASVIEEGCDCSVDGPINWQAEIELMCQRLKPVPVSERLPEPKNCIPHPRTQRGNWCWGFERCDVSLARPARWRLMHMETIEMEASHWISGQDLPIPSVEVEE